MKLSTGPSKAQGKQGGPRPASGAHRIYAIDPDVNSYEGSGDSHNDECSLKPYDRSREGAVDPEGAAQIELKGPQVRPVFFSTARGESVISVQDAQHLPQGMVLCSHGPVATGDSATTVRTAAAASFFPSLGFQQPSV